MCRGDAGAARKTIRGNSVKSLLFCVILSFSSVILFAHDFNPDYMPLSLRSFQPPDKHCRYLEISGHYGESAWGLNPLKTSYENGCFTADFGKEVVRGGNGTVHAVLEIPFKAEHIFINGYGSLDKLQNPGLGKAGRILLAKDRSRFLFWTLRVYIAYFHYLMVYDYPAPGEIGIAIYSDFWEFHGDKPIYRELSPVTLRLKQEGKEWKIIHRQEGQALKCLSVNSDGMTFELNMTSQVVKWSCQKEITLPIPTPSLPVLWQIFLDDWRHECLLREVAFASPAWKTLSAWNRRDLISFLNSRLGSTPVTSKDSCGFGPAKEGLVALQSLGMLTGRPLLQYSGSDPELRTLVSDARKKYAAPFYAVALKVLKKPGLREKVGAWYLETVSSQDTGKNGVIQ